MHVRLDIAECVRLALFKTGLDDHPYWTPGGTICLFNYRGHPYGLTCRHVAAAQGYDWAQLVIPHTKDGERASTVQAVHKVQDCWGHAEHTDIADLTLIKLGPERLISRYQDSLFVLDEGTIASAEAGDVIVAHGTLYHETYIDGDGVAPLYCALSFRDAGCQSNDGTLRSATVTLVREPNIKALTGLSGGAAYNETKQGISGIITRGRLDGLDAKLHYLDFAYILPALRAMHDGSEVASYKARATH